MKFPVFKTSFDAFEFLWRVRRLALRLGTLPLVLSLVVAFATESLSNYVISSQPAVPSPDLRATYFSLGQGVLQLLIMLPITVVWLRLSVLGKAAAVGKPVFSFGGVERRFLGLQLQVLVGYVAGLAVTVLVTRYLLALSVNGPLYWSYIGVVWLAVCIVTLLVSLMRISLAFVASALDQPMSL